MNVDNPIQVLQTGFRISLGATASLIESLQDSQKREEILSKLTNSEFAQLTQEWAEKGEVTEQEARNFVDSLLSQQSNQTPGETPGTSGTTETSTPAASPGVQLELQELTAQIAAMRAELERLRNQDSQS
ncbi:hypothetical protein [Argonema galeatum]|uniref:hypothetical protein n=1 Tax=Argonema galeatum TaxID=2942762 RepID=UPI00201168B1|nr:hypothetical protein [Argonema galeatum]MCL1466348.1 hypothetical protein [Argonema galeatum A003/A1]